MPSPIQIERWVMPDDFAGLKAEISVIFYIDRGCFEIAYFEGRDCRIQETFIFSLDEAYQKLQEVRRKVDPDAFSKGQARFVRRCGKTREDVAQFEREMKRGSRPISHAIPYPTETKKSLVEELLGPLCKTCDKPRTNCDCDPPTCWLCGKVCLSYPCSGCGAPAEDPMDPKDPILDDPRRESDSIDDDSFHCGG